MGLVGKTILVVDDDTNVTGLMQDALAYAGANVLVATTVKDGLAALRSGSFELVLLDYVISEKVAEQFLAKAIVAGEGGSVPVIIVSGHGENLSMDRFEDYPQVKAVLSKPFDPGVLLRLVERTVL